MSGNGDAWSLLVPVKRLDLAKTRLDLDPPVRAELALAMAIDTVRAALGVAAVGEVVVITDDGRAAAALLTVGARVVADQPDAGLNPALVYGASLAANTRIAALSADLPGLRGIDLDVALGHARDHGLTVVSDAAGTGTTLLSAAAPNWFVPSYGADSRAAHVAAGAVDLTDLAGASLRHDVDTIDALRQATALGVGEATARVIASFAALLG